MYNSTINKNKISGSTEQGIYFSYATTTGYGNVISNNQIRNSTLDGVILNNQIKFSVSGNSIVNSGGSGISFVNGDSGLFIGNTIADSWKEGLDLRGNYTLVTGNTFYNNGGVGGGQDNGISVGLYSSNPAYNMIVGNTFRKGTNQDYAVRIFAGSTNTKV